MMMPLDARCSYSALTQCSYTVLVYKDPPVEQELINTPNGAAAVECCFPAKKTSLADSARLIR